MKGNEYIKELENERYSYEMNRLMSLEGIEGIGVLLEVAGSDEFLNNVDRCNIGAGLQALARFALMMNESIEAVDKKISKLKFQ